MASMASPQRMGTRSWARDADGGAEQAGRHKEPVGRAPRRSTRRTKAG